MTIPKQLREFGPTFGPSVVNASASPIPAHRICKVALGTTQGIELATDPSDLFAGVSDREVLPGVWTSVRKSGVVHVEAGDALLPGDRVTPDAEGRAVLAEDGEGVGVAWMGIAWTGASAAGELIECELRLSGGDGEGPP